MKGRLRPARLICGNALEPDTVAALMAGGRAQMVFTDPPYNVPIQGNVGGWSTLSPSSRQRSADHAALSASGSGSRFQSSNWKHPPEPSQHTRCGEGRWPTITTTLGSARKRRVAEQRTIAGSDPKGRKARVVGRSTTYVRPKRAHSWLSSGSTIIFPAEKRRGLSWEATGSLVSPSSTMVAMIRPTAGDVMNPRYDETAM